MADPMRRGYEKQMQQSRDRMEKFGIEKPPPGQSVRTGGIGRGGINQKGYPEQPPEQQRPSYGALLPYRPSHNQMMPGERDPNQSYLMPVGERKQGNGQFMGHHPGGMPQEMQNGSYESNPLGTYRSMDIPNPGRMAKLGGQHGMGSGVYRR